jgi:hypothetical protein
MMSPFYQTHLRSQLNRADYLLLTLLVNLLQSIKQVKLETLATRCAFRLDFEIQAKGATTYHYPLHLKVGVKKSRDFCPCRN